LVSHWTSQNPRRRPPGTELVDYRLLRDGEQFAIERCERDRLGGERWVEVKAWDREAALRHARMNGADPVTVVLADRVVQLESRLEEPPTSGRFSRGE
jgi:hypothetical protein